MNERIRELAEQAGFSFKYKTAPDELNPGHKLQDLEKFAELIVRECIDIMDKSTFNNIRTTYDKEQLDYIIQVLSEKMKAIFND